jgi:hypothetical protein
MLPSLIRLTGLRQRYMLSSPTGRGSTDASSWRMADTISSIPILLFKGP